MHAPVPQALNGFFDLVTLSGPAKFLVPASVLAVVALLGAKRRFEALLMAGIATAPNAPAASRTDTSVFRIDMFVSSN